MGQQGAPPFSGNFKPLYLIEALIFVYERPRFNIFCTKGAKVNNRGEGHPLLAHALGVK